MRLVKWIIRILAIGIFGCLAVPVHAAEIVASGTCGETAAWTLDDSGLLSITGIGTLSGWDTMSPWYSYTSKIKEVQIASGHRDLPVEVQRKAGSKELSGGGRLCAKTATLKGGCLLYC